MSIENFALRDIITMLENIADKNEKGLVVNSSGDFTITINCEPEQDYMVTERISLKPGKFTDIEIKSNLKITIGGGL